MLRVGLVIPIYNRPEYLRRSLASVAKTQYPVEAYMINDASTDPATNYLFDRFRPPRPICTKVINPTNQNVHRCLSAGWTHLFESGVDVLVNLDSDALVVPHWIDVLLDLHNRFPDQIVGGFHTTNHSVVTELADLRTKRTIGGINMLFGRDLFSLVQSCLNVQGWDWQVCELMQRLGRPFVVSRPSVIQHVGVKGLTSSKEGIYDVAADFEPELNLPRGRLRCLGSGTTGI